MRKLLSLLLILALLVVPASAVETKLQVERQIYAYLTEELELPGAAACGILANIEKESNFNPRALGDNGTSYGLCQWHDGRYSALISFCRRNGLDYTTTEGQLEYLRHELQGTYSDIFAQIRNVDDEPSGAYRAAYIWCVEFERPSMKETKGIIRGNLARGKYWTRYRDNMELTAPEETEPAYDFGEMFSFVPEEDVTVPTASETEPVETQPETIPAEPAAQTEPAREAPKAEIREPAAPEKEKLPLAVGAAVTGFTGVGLLLSHRSRKENENSEEGAI